MKNEVIVFFDVDGTLYDNQNQRILESTKIAMKKLKENGIKIAIATGRARFMLSTISEILEDVDYYVLINGQVIMDKTNILFHKPIPTSKIEVLIADMEGLNVAYGFEGRDAKAVNKVDAHVMKSFGGLTLRIPPVQPSFYQEHDVYQMWVFTPIENIEILRKKHIDFQFLRWMDVGFDALPLQVSKGDGVKRLVNMLEINPENVYAFGDAENDFEMIRDVKYGIAMGNATSKVKEVAQYVTEDVSRDGIYLALKHYGLI